jgi:TolB protein
MSKPLDGLRATALLPALLLAALILAAGQANAGDTLSIDIFGPGQGKVNVMILPPKPLGGEPVDPMAEEFQRLVEADLQFLPFLNVVPANTLLGGDPARGVKPQDIDFGPLTLSRVDLAITFGWQPAGGVQDLEARAIETFDQRVILGKAWGQIDRTRLQEVADRFAKLLMEAITGKSGFFGSQIAFSRKTGEGREIFVGSPLGRDIQQVTKLGGICMSPAWSFDGRYLAFSRVGDSSHLLGIWDRASNKITQTKFSGNTVIAPAYTPEGNIAVTLALKGSPQLYLLDKSLRPESPLAPSGTIDVSASFSRDGARMAFVSARAGNPHIFVLDRASGQVVRVTYEGKYNTNPQISGDGKLVVFSRDTSAGHRIFLSDLTTGQEKQLSFGPGSDEQPCFDPDGYFVAFSSSRAGANQIYMTTRHGEEAKPIFTGGAAAANAPAWGPAAATEGQ